MVEREMTMPFLCRIGWHRWTIWREPLVPKVGHLMQHRVCALCNRESLRPVRGVYIVPDEDGAA